MRYIILVLLSTLSVVVSGSLLAGLTTVGLQADIVLLIVISLALIEKTSMPIVFAALTGLFMDILFSTALGVYAISYTVVAATVMFVFANAKKFNFLLLAAAAGAGYILKEACIAVLVYLLGARFDFSQMLVRYILPSALISGVLIFVVYWALQKLFRLNWMRPPVLHKWDEF